MNLSTERVLYVKITYKSSEFKIQNSIMKISFEQRLSIARKLVYFLDIN